MVISYTLIKCHQYRVGDGGVLWKNCLLGSRSIKKSYKVDGTSYTRMLETRMTPVVALTGRNEGCHRSLSW